MDFLNKNFDWEAHFLSKRKVVQEGLPIEPGEIFDCLSEAGLQVFLNNKTVHGVWNESVLSDHLQGLESIDFFLLGTLGNQRIRLARFTLHVHDEYDDWDKWSDCDLDEAFLMAYGFHVEGNWIDTVSSRKFGDLLDFLAVTLEADVRSKGSFNWIHTEPFNPQL